MWVIINIYRFNLNFYAKTLFDKGMGPLTRPCEQPEKSL